MVKADVPWSVLSCIQRTPKLQLLADILKNHHYQVIVFTNDYLLFMFVYLKFSVMYNFSDFFNTFYLMEFPQLSVQTAFMSFHKLGSAVFVDFFITILTPLAHIILFPTPFDQIPKALSGSWLWISVSMSQPLIPFPIMGCHAQP